MAEIKNTNHSATSPPLDMHDGAACLMFGGLEYDLIPLSIFEYYGSKVFFVKPASGDTPSMISATFFTDAGQVALKIEENAIVVNQFNWDVEVVGNSITVRRTPGKTCLKLLIEPPGRIAIEKLDMRYKDCHLFGNRHTFCVGRQIDQRNFLWVGAKVKILENRFRGSAIRVDNPARLAREWNALGGTTTRRPILRAEGEDRYIEFRTSGFPDIPNGFFSTAFLGNKHAAFDSYSGILHFRSGIVIANQVGSYRVGSVFYNNAPLNMVRKLFKGEGPHNVNELAKHFFEKKV